ncbi:hypothetical protein THOG05_540012 [Vibrio rotiferianus]|nr:hypothetical protein THOG05_540012 [Vibrio rotiferianus]CAH1582399.1 hypothetical protein THOG10_310053 [Vibrio rotiferianus]CAH1584506.1 hypothetical protein THOB06_310053 [Vibrio rotiferianus]CAH1587520.1 hypothetical protein THOE12_90001 [Vibrio rotiferianus]
MFSPLSCLVVGNGAHYAKLSEIRQQFFSINPAKSIVRFLFKQRGAFMI